MRYPRSLSAALTLGLTLAGATAASAQAPATGRAAATPAGQSWRPTFSASLRSRAEGWNWFDAGEAGRYVFLGNLLRLGASAQHGEVGWRVELAAPLLVNLPDDAIAAAPQGQLGLGANYWATSDSSSTDGSLFLKQAVVRIGAPQGKPGHSVRAGRFEFVDGAEVIPADPTLAAVKRDRVAHRLLGNFGWSHVGRSFDGAAYAFGRNGLDVTVFGGRATRGVFRANGWGGLDVYTGYAAATVPVSRSKTAPGEARLFALHYRDDRELVKTDNRPAPVRSTDSTRVAVTTLGGHWLQLVSTGAGPVDLMLWGAWQTGEWGREDHRAAAGAVEVGFQPGGLPGLRPWLRAGYFRSTGDSDAADGRHETWFQVLPTPRIYARTPFFNQMNLEEAFGSLTLRPGQALSVRTDVRVLGLAERGDLWYAGGGAFEPTSFGYAGRPSGGAKRLATLIDTSADLKVGRHVTVTGYVARMLGGDVIDRIYGAGAGGTFGYLEVELRR
jgi:hypothetical protein